MSKDLALNYIYDVNWHQKERKFHYGMGTIFDYGSRVWARSAYKELLLQHAKPPVGRL